jgi:hypothetical protein
MSTDRTLQDDDTDNLQTTIGVITTTFTWKTNIVLLHHQTSRTLYDALIQNLSTYQMLFIIGHCSFQSIEDNSINRYSVNIGWP